MPSGTGKTVSLLSVLFAKMKQSSTQESANAQETQQENPGKKRERPSDNPSDAKPLYKTVYCTRTIAEVNQVMKEAEKVQTALYGEDDISKPLVVAIASRKHFCLNDRCNGSKSVDSKCREFTSVENSINGNNCPYYEVIYFI